MKRYTIKDLSEGKCAVINDGTRKELAKVLANPCLGIWKYYWKDNCSDIKPNLPCQSVKDFIIEDEFPEKWALKLGDLSEDERKQFLEWLPNDDFRLFYKSSQTIFHYPNYGNEKGFEYGWHLNDTCIIHGYTQITFEQFANHYLNNKQMEKKIIGYKLIKPEYKEAACNIGFTDLKGRLGENTISSSDTIYKLSQAGVLDIWFEPVYEEVKKDIIINMGQFELKVTPKGIFHKSEDITSYVKDLYCFAKCENFGFGVKKGSGNKWDFHVKDVIISKSGCESSETKLSQWFDVWEQYQKIKE